MNKYKKRADGKKKPDEKKSQAKVIIAGKEKTLSESSEYLLDMLTKEEE